MVPFHRQVSFSEMSTPALVVVGDENESLHLTTRGWKWLADPFYFGSSPKSLLTLFGGDHCFETPEYDAAETKDESAERVAAIQRMTAAYSRDVLCAKDGAWKAAVDALYAIGSTGEVVRK
jgi:hypothetical protein